MNDPKPRVLMVDDEPNVLSAFRRALGRRYELTTAEGGQDALAAMNAGEPFPVIVTDMRMPAMDGLAFLHKARAIHPDSVYMMLTGNADQATAVRAINEGQIFRFLTKPCDPESLERALQAALRQYELVTAERVLLRDTLTGSVRLLIEALSLSEPVLARTVWSIRRTIQHAIGALSIERDWRYPLAGSLCLLGVVVEFDARADGWHMEERLETCAHIGAKLLRNIPRLEQVSEMVERQRERGALPDDLQSVEPGKRTIIGVRLLRFAVDLERLVGVHETDRRAIERAMKDAGHDGRLVALLDALLDERVATTSDGAPTPAAHDAAPPMIRRTVAVRSLRAGMVVGDNVESRNSKLFLSAGQELTPILIERLRSLARSGQIEPEMDVLIAGPEGADEHWASHALAREIPATQPPPRAQGGAAA